MRILLITTVFPSPVQPNKGAFNKEMVRALSVDHEVRVVSPIAWTIARGARAPRRGVVDGVETHYPIYFYTPRVLRRWYGEFFWSSVRRTLRSVAQGFRPDIVVGYWAHPDGLAAVRLGRAIGAPSVVMVGGTDVLVLAADRGRRREIRRVLEQADALIAVSHDLKRAVVSMGLPAANVHVVYRGVDAGLFKSGDRLAARARLGIPPNTRALLWVGHMVTVKGLEVLIAACALARDRAEFRLYLVGSGPLLAALARQVKTLGLDDRVQFVGYVAHDQLGDWYRAADVTVLPSHSEGVPNVLLESIASGTPFVATRVGGVPEIADPLVDRLVAPGDPAALATGIVAALAAPNGLARRCMPSSVTDASAQLVAVLAAVRPRVTQSAPAGVRVRASAAPAPARRN